MSIWLSVDPLASKYPSLSPYVYCANNPIMLVDPDGREIEVTANENGTYTVTGGTLNSDKNIYIMKDGERTGGILGQTMTEHSFFNEEGEAVRGAIINPNDNSGQEFIDNLKFEDPNLASYGINAGNNGDYNFKNEGGSTELNQNRGMPIKDGNGNTVYGTARDIGNYGAGYVAGRNGLTWGETRTAFDGYQTFSDGSWKNGVWSKEGMPSQSAQKIGYNAGVFQRGQDMQNRKQRQSEQIKRFPNGCK